MPFQPASAALSHLIVLDLARVRAGPTCARQLADWGANVIKIEAPAAQQAADGPGGARHGSDFQNVQRNRRSLALDLKHPDGKAILRRLARRADVLVENFRPAVKTRLGIDYETLSALNPRLVYASISGFGQDGPYADRPGLDQIAQGLGGMMSITGLPEQGPVRAGIPIADLCAGLYGALGVLVALLARESTGRGQWVQTSLLQAQLAMLDFQATRWLVDGDVPKQAGNNHPTTIPTGTFRAADGYLNIAVAGQILWERFCDVLEISHLAADPAYADNTARSRNRDTLNREIAARIETETVAVWIERLNAAGVPCGPVNTIDKAFADPQARHLGIAQQTTSAALGALTLLGQPVTLSETPSRIARAAPEIGEHSEEILAEFGYSGEEIESFRQNGVV